MVRYVMIACLMATSASAQDSKEDSCKYQGQVMAAVQQARLDRVREADVEQHILQSEATWPERYNGAITHFAPVVYGAKRRDLKRVDLGAQIEAQCLENWDTIQEMKKSVGN